MRDEEPGTTARDEERRTKLKAMGERIRAARGALTQSVLAARIRCDVSSYSRWERGDAEPSVASIVAISEATGASIDWIVTGRGEAPLPATGTDGT